MDKFQQKNAAYKRDEALRRCESIRDEVQQQAQKEIDEREKELAKKMRDIEAHNPPKKDSP